LKETAGSSKEETVKAVETAQAERTEVGNSGLDGQAGAAQAAFGKRSGR
jgi:hypothetical protein